MTPPANRSLDGEKRELLAARWESLPSDLKTPNQLAGRTAIACGATHHVMEKCNFSCTCCYLGAEANKTEPLPFSEVKEQLDTLRAELGPLGKAQITAGEVTLLPLADLGRIVRYALEIGLDPMVMTHGQRFLDEPDYLISLVNDYGLRKISVHIDSTQRGRPGITGRLPEEDLHRVRDDFAELIRKVRKVTGHPLKAASTVTVTAGNVREMATVIHWFTLNSDAFRLLSLQPVAEVGRTRKAQTEDPLEGDLLWEQIEQGFGKKINPAPMHFGHHKCNTTAPFVIINTPIRPLILEGIRESHPEDAALFSSAVQSFSPLLSWSIQWQKNALAVGGHLLTHPRLAGQILHYGIRRTWQERTLFARLIADTLKTGRLPKVHSFLLIIHRFMSAAELTTEEGKERLDACIFKVPVEGELISMCEMNATDIRAKIDRLQIQSQKNPPSQGNEKLASSS